MSKVIDFEDAVLKKTIKNYQYIVDQLNSDTLDNAPAECECGSMSFKVYCDRFECSNCNCVYIF